VGLPRAVAEGAVTKTLRESDVVFLDGHDPLRPISRMSADTLRLSVDGDGLPVESDLDTRISYVNDLALNVENRNVKGMSFGFRSPRTSGSMATTGSTSGRSERLSCSRSRRQRFRPTPTRMLLSDPRFCPRRSAAAP
jgi:HK97 family phage prohead protease